MLITVSQLDQKLLDITARAPGTQNDLKVSCTLIIFQWHFTRVSDYKHMEYKTIGITHGGSHFTMRRDKINHDQQSSFLRTSRLKTLTFFRVLFMFVSILINILFVGVLCLSVSDHNVAL